VVVLPASEGRAPGKDIMRGLLKESKGTEAEAQEAPEPEAPVVLPAGEEKPKEATSREVLDGLLGKPGKEDPGSDDEADKTGSER